jgi:ATP-binding cassette subfamily B protein/ATP-binding cassette subfamily C protein
MGRGRSGFRKEKRRRTGGGASGKTGEMTPGQNAKSGREQLGQALSACRGGLWAVFLFSACINLLMLALPIYSLQVYDRILSSRSIDTLLHLTLIVGVALAVLGLLEAIRGQVMVGVSTWLERRLAPVLLGGAISGALRASPSAQALRDISTVRAFIAGPNLFPLLDAPWLPIFLAATFLVHPLLGWLATGGALIMIALAVAGELRTRRQIERAGAAATRAQAEAEAATRNADVIVAMGMVGNVTARWRKFSNAMLDLQAEASVRGGRISAIARFARLALQVAALGLGAALAIDGAITGGAMIAGSILMARALAPVDAAIAAWRSMLQARGAYRRVVTALDAAPPERHAMPLPAPQGTLRVEGVRFQHANAKEPVLRNVGFPLAAGEHLGLMGPTASGKTTLARIIVGNLKSADGVVRLDGADMAEWDPDDRGRHIGYLPQDIELFSATVRENIARMGEGDPDAVVAAARLAGGHDMILALPKGYDTEIGAGGAALSGGQRQRVGLARALYGNPRLVVLDEPNSSLDLSGEHALLSALETLKARGVTTIVIAHRPNILRRVDKILVLGKGTVQRFGPRDDVVRELMGPRPTPAPVPAERIQR